MKRGGGGGGGGGGCKLVVEESLNPFTAMMSLQKLPVKVRKLKPVSLFVFFFAALVCERIFIKKRSVESRCVIGPENILFTGASVHHSARKFYSLGQ